MTKKYTFFRSVDFNRIIVVISGKEKTIQLHPEQHNLLLLLSEKKAGDKYSLIPEKIMLDILEMYNFL